MEPIYLDNAATTRVDADIAAAAIDAMCGDYGNPSSLHGFGVKAERLVKAAQANILAALGVRGGRVIFTGGGTEADNLAILGTAKASGGRGRHIITSAAEHPAVLEPARELLRQGYEVTFLSPGNDGAVSAHSVAEACRDDTVLVSVMAVNNETGALSDIAAIASAVRERAPRALIHCDAVQAFCKVDFLLRGQGVDLITVSGPKHHAPKGVGALYIRDKARIEPLIYGGGQQGGLRPGTENVPLIHAFGLAAKNAALQREERYRHAVSLRDRLLDGLKSLGGVHINSPRSSSPYIVNFSMPGYRSEVLLHFLEARGIYVSSGSACGRGERSHVLSAMNLPPRVVDSALRIGLSYHNTPCEADAFLNGLRAAREQLITR